MRILVGWDDPNEADLITLYLTSCDNEAVVVEADPEQFLAQLQEATWDVILLTISHPDHDAAFEVFSRIRQDLPNCPVVCACRTEETMQLAKYISRGLKTYVLRDVGKDFVFLLQATLHSTHQAALAEHEQKVAEQMRAEIESVRRFQTSIIPRELYQPSGYRVGGRYEPSQIRVLGGHPVNLAGGDYYEIVPLGKKAVGLLVADAAGHGMRACTSIMAVQTILTILRERKYRNAAAFVSDMNRHFCQQHVCQQDGSLVTLLYGVLRLDRGEFSWTSAGHPAPLIHDLKADRITEAVHSDRPEPPLGVDAGFKYSLQKIALPQRLRMLLYTDGLAEAHPGDDRSTLFGVEGISATLRRCQQEPVHDALEALFADSHNFTQGAGRHDDTSAMLLARE